MNEETRSPHQEIAMAIQEEFEDELDNTVTDQELLNLSEKLIKEILPGSTNSAISAIREEILKLYKPIN